MKSNYPKAIDFVFKYEGGYSNHPNDPGGPTNWGITIHDARKYWKSNATAADVKVMPKSVAQEIYRTRYAAPIHFDAIASGLDACTLDTAINSGTGRGDDFLADALGVPRNTRKYADLAALSQTIPLKDLPAKVKVYCKRRLSFLQSLRIWSTFGKGWGRRVAALEVLGVQLALAAAGKTTSEIKAELQTERTTTTKTQSKDVVKTGTAGAAEATHVWNFWEWDVLHVSIAVGALLLIAFFVHRMIQNKNRISEYDAAIKQLEAAVVQVPQ